MLLECPSCHARYMVPAGAFAQGPRQVRCARCRHEWMGELPLTVDVFLPLSPPVPAETGIRPKEPVRHIPNLPALIKQQNWRVWGLRFAAAIAMVVVLLAWPILGRQAIASAHPEVEDLYEFLGLPIAHTGAGLIFDKVTSELRYDGGTMRLIVDGKILNSTKRAQLIPDIKARALGPDKTIIQSWTVDPPAANVPARGEVPFHTEINAPMEHTVEDVYLEFYVRDEEKKDGNDRNSP